MLVLCYITFSYLDIIFAGLLKYTLKMVIDFVLSRHDLGYVQTLKIKIKRLRFVSPNRSKALCEH